MAISWILDSSRQFICRSFFIWMDFNSIHKIGFWLIMFDMPFLSSNWSFFSKSHGLWIWQMLLCVKSNVLKFNLMIKKTGPKCCNVGSTLLVKEWFRWWIWMIPVLVGTIFSVLPGALVWGNWNFNRGLLERQPYGFRKWSLCSDVYIGL